MARVSAAITIRAVPHGGRYHQEVAMTRKRVTASEKKQLHEWAMRQIDAGMGVSESTASTAETWGAATETLMMSSMWPTKSG